MRFIKGNSNNTLVIVGMALSAISLQACSTTDVYNASYAPALSAPSSSATIHAGTGDYKSYAARDAAIAARPQPHQFNYGLIYGATQDGDVSLPAFNYTKMNTRYLRQSVRYFGAETVGSIVIDAQRKYLYLVQPGGMAIRYGIAVGKEGYGWTGNSVLQWKQKWPTWTPPKEMIERSPKLAKYAEGMKGSTDNPLGARAMYLFKNGKDTLYRIHGTTKPYSIGRAASSGCFRMINQDVIDLYSRIGKKAGVYVRPQIAASLVEER